MIPLPSVHFRYSQTGCTQSVCHGNIEPIRQPDSKMFQKIAARGKEVGDTDGCVVCHGGNPQGTDAASAHRGTVDALAKLGGPDDFFADPGSPWVNERTCGQCHRRHVKTQWNSLMMTETGKIQGTTWAFGGQDGYEHKWGNYDAKNPGPPDLRTGSTEYKLYMQQKAAAHPNLFVSQIAALTQAPGDPAKGPPLSVLAEKPELSAFTYIRTECNRCHLGVKGRQKRGDYRGMGCSACHIPYSVEGYYEGRDLAIPHDRPGHLLMHSIQATRDAPLQVGSVRYSGIPVETCTTCHNRGKRIGVSYQGLMESAWESPFTEGGGGQIGLHTKSYLSMAKDVHYEKGMFCQDCHTSSDVHGDGFLAGTNLAAVEIECTDCHGTPDRYPWELPLGTGDENGPGEAKGPPRGVVQSIPEDLQQGFVAPISDGYLRTARGNPMPKVVRKQDHVVVYTAGGKDLILKPLKWLFEQGKLSVEARTAMVQVKSHVAKMECYTCHSAWAPQCYGCHVKIDYSTGKQEIDWVKAGQFHATPQGRTVRGENLPLRIPGTVQEMRSYLRWEDPVLGMNGEGRVSPLVPGCQVSATVIGQNGKEIVRNHVFSAKPFSEGAGAEGPPGSDMSPTTPHTVGKSRSCESCHANDKAIGYGLGGGQMMARMDVPTMVDLITQSGQMIPSRHSVQIEPISRIADFSQVVTRDGRQTQTVGHHFLSDGPLSAEQREKLERKNLCTSCHQHLPDRDPASSLLHHVAAHAGKLPTTPAAHSNLVSKITRLAAWTQVLLAGLLGVGLLAWLRRKILSRLRHRT
ncbi:MAG TPA: cytochrome C [Pseudomonadota bacterium]|nr:cytochrome C [Pseudomonadota bacterium]